MEGPRTENVDSAVPSVDFKVIAYNAVKEGLFEPNEIGAAEADTPNSMINNPYFNGPMTIRRFGKDVPNASMHAVRKNFIRANRLLLPTEQVMLFFHHQFASENVLESTMLADAVSKYPGIKVMSERKNRTATSFDVETPRDGRGRTLFTEEELNAANQLGQVNPELVMTVVTFLAVIKEYLTRLKNEFIALSQREEFAGTITEKDLEDFDAFMRQWSGSNFTDNLIPALALFLHDGNTEVDAALFENALAFMMSNGAFRNDVTVPASVADDGQERVVQFVCPAMGKIKGILSDGALFQRIHTILQKESEKDDSKIADKLEHIREVSQFAGLA